MNGAEFLKLEMTIRKYTQRIHSTLLLANTYLTPSKPSYESLERYRLLRIVAMRDKRITGMKQFLFFSFLRLRLLIYISFYSILHLIGSFILFSEWINASLITKRPIPKTIALEIVPSSRSINPFQSSFPAKILSQSSESELMYFLFNGTKIPRTILRRKLDDTPCFFYIIPKVLNPIRTIVTISSNLRVSFGFYRNNYSKSLELYEKIFILELMRVQFHRSTYANQILSQSLSVYDKINTQVECALLTLEGHAHERLFIKKLKSYNPSVKIIAYQHAPILSSQFSFFMNIQYLDQTDSLCLTGKLPFELLSERNNENFLPTTTILGSDKHIEPRNFTFEGKHEILFLPEGTFFATIELINVIKLLLSKSESYRIKLRLHPDFKKNVKIQRILSTITSPNFSLSSRSLIHDFVGSRVSVYRGSAAAIQGLSLGVIPIHYSSNPSIDVDPISQRWLNHPACHNISELRGVLSKVFFKNEHMTPQDQRDMLRVSKKYFEKID